ncbi:protein-(glutamine-N5) methyltransferase, release factor-specific, partial [Gammaproteobacteria bacterium]|nr:protein-(glutamine-N5) methyltransferase, release factor-specific [Gammaproteobacteria bacterium]
APALFGGMDGLDCLRNICREASHHLNPGGFLALEHGYDQKDAVAILIKEAGLELNSQIDDYAGLPRVTTALRPET